MKLTRKAPALLAAVLLVPTAAAGQNEDVPTGVTAADKITIAASEKSTGELRRDYWRAEKKFYSIYNKLNEDSLYDVRCTKEAPTGSVIKVQACRPKFLDRAIKEGKINKGEKLDSNSDVSAKIATYRKNMAALVAANPDLKAAADSLNLAHAELEADKQRRANK